MATNGCPSKLAKKPTNRLHTLKIDEGSAVPLGANQRANIVMHKSAEADIDKANDNHDDRGRFSSGSGGGKAPGDAPAKSAQQAATRAYVAYKTDHPRQWEVKALHAAQLASYDHQRASDSTSDPQDLHRAARDHADQAASEYKASNQRYGGDRTKKSLFSKMNENHDDKGRFSSGSGGGGGTKAERERERKTGVPPHIQRIVDARQIVRSSSGVSGRTDEGQHWGRKHGEENKYFSSRKAAEAHAHGTGTQKGLFTMAKNPVGSPNQFDAASRVTGDLEDPQEDDDTSESKVVTNTANQRKRPIGSGLLKALTSFVKGFATGGVVPISTDEILQKHTEQSYRDHLAQLTEAFEFSVDSIVSSPADNTHELLFDTTQQFIDKAGTSLVEMAKTYDVTEGFVALSLLEDVTTDVAKIGRVISGANMSRLRQAIQHLSDMVSEAGPDQNDSSEVDMAKLQDILKTLPDDERAVVEEAIDKAGMDGNGPDSGGKPTRAKKLGNGPGGDVAGGTGRDDDHEQGNGTEGPGPGRGLAKKFPPKKPAAGAGEPDEDDAPTANPFAGKLAKIAKEQPELVEILKDLQETVEKANGRAEAAEALAGGLIEKEHNAVVLAKTRDYAVLGLGRDFAPVLASIAKKAPEEYAKLTKALDIVAKNSKTNLRPMLVEVGKGVEDSGTSGSAAEQFEQLAKAKVAEGKGTISFAKAYTEVTKEHPELYTKYLDEKKGGN